MTGHEGLLQLTARAAPDSASETTLTLPFERRQRTRLRVTLDDGTEAALMLPRGEVLRGGDRLRSSCGRVVTVRAADEPVSHVACDDPRGLARAAYHLGNRHVPVQVGDGWLRYLHDHVLDAMVEGLGLAVQSMAAPFEPEAGAYAGHHHHGHGHGHGHGDGNGDGGAGHAHGHGHRHAHEHAAAIVQADRDANDDGAG